MCDKAKSISRPYPAIVLRTIKKNVDDLATDLPLVAFFFNLEAFCPKVIFDYVSLPFAFVYLGFCLHLIDFVDPVSQDSLLSTYVYLGFCLRITDFIIILEYFFSNALFYVYLGITFYI